MDHEDIHVYKVLGEKKIDLFLANWKTEKKIAKFLAISYIPLLYMHSHESLPGT